MFSKFLKLIKLKMDRNNFRCFTPETLVFSTLGISFLIIVTTLVIVNYLIVLIGNENTDELIAKVAYLYIEQVRFALWPEPVERVQFVISLMIISVSACFIIPFVEKLIRHKKNGRLIYLATLTTFVIFIMTIAWLALKPAPENFLVDSPLPYYRDIRVMIDKFVGYWTFIITILLVGMLKHEKIKIWITKSLTVLCTTLLAAMFVINIATPATYFGWMEHFNAVFYSLDQVIKGKTLLVNITNQYGLYPHFLEPVFLLIGFNVLTFTATLSFLTLVSHIFLYVFIYRATNSHLVSALALIAIMYIRFYLFIFWGTGFWGSGDSYFQYNPIRLFFPCLLLYLAQIYLNKKSDVLCIVVSILASVSILWNVDSGVIVFSAWILMLIYEHARCRSLQELNWGSIFKIVIGNLLILSGVLLIYALFMYERSGNWIDIYQLFKYQRIFYTGGFFMMHMPVFNSWNIIFGIYLLGFVYAIQALLRKKQDIHDTEIFLSSIIGIGIFSYYQGRSHDYNLLTVSYPAIVLIALAAGRREIFLLKFSHQFFTYYCSIFSLLFFNVLFIASIPAAFVAVEERVNLVFNSFKNDDGKMPNIRIASDFIEKNTKPGEVVLILPQPDFYDGMLYHLSKTSSPLPVPGGSERVLISDFEEVSEFLIRNKEVKVFSSLNYRYPKINNILLEKYVVKSSNEHMKYFYPKP